MVTVMKIAIRTGIMVIISDDGGNNRDGNDIMMAMVIIVQVSLDCQLDLA